jgi:DNA-binding transcriptional regulator PaaX
MKEGLFILDDFSHWNKKVDKKQIRDTIRDLNKRKLIKKKDNYNGSILISLTEKGRLRAINTRFKNFYNRKEKWDGKWRMVAFDIPDECKKGRNALRYRLRLGGFYELQESLFLYPYDCKREIEDFVGLFKLEKYVRFALIDFIDNEKDIKMKMGVGLPE